MIPIAALQRTAEALMAKAAIEIPTITSPACAAAADTEKGDLSAFVIQAMLENYEAAKHDRRAMCGDTGVPRWYVKIGNEARIEGGPIALEAALRRATATPPTTCRCGRTACIRSGAPTTTTIAASARRRSSIVPPRRRLDRAHHRPQGGLFGSRLPHAVSRPSGLDGIKRFYLDTLIQFGKRGLACQPAIVGSGSAAPRTSAWCSASRRPACDRRTAIPIRASPRWRRELKEIGNNIGMGAMGFMGLIDGGRLPHRGRLLPHRRHADERAYVLPLLAARLRARRRRRRRDLPTDPMWFTDYAAQRRRMGAARDRGGVTVDGRIKTAKLTLPASTEDLRKLEIDTVVYLTGRVFTAREGVYKRAIEDGFGMPASRDALGIVNFHCSPAAAVNADGTYKVGAVTATASFRFAKWLEGWFKLSGCNIIIGKGGMTSEIYRRISCRTGRSISPPSATAPARCSAAASSASPASTGSKSSASPRRYGCSTSRISGRSWSRATSKATACSSARTPRSMPGSTSSTKA